MAAVRALPIEINPPAAKVLSIRSTAMRLPPSSTTAITPVVLRSCASAIPAAMTRLAPSRSSDLCVTVCADAATAKIAMPAARDRMEVILRVIDLSETERKPGDLESPGLVRRLLLHRRKRRFTEHDLCI